MVTLKARFGQLYKSMSCRASGTSILFPLQSLLIMFLCIYHFL